MIGTLGALSVTILRYAFDTPLDIFIININFTHVYIKSDYIFFRTDIGQSYVSLCYHSNTEIAKI